MIRFIWNNWWRNKGRFILLLVGALIVSTGLSYLVGVTQSNNGTIVEELQNRWESSYHIVVRPPDTRSVTEELNLLEPNYQSGLSGGITMEQYEKIKTMEDIDVAAPIAMIGFMNNSIEMNTLTISEPGVYRLKITDETDTGAGIRKDAGNTYFTVGNWQPEGLGKEYGASPFMGEQSLEMGSEVMIAGVDPEAESALVGLDQSVLDEAGSRYFKPDDQAEVVEYEDEDFTQTRIPVLLSNREYVESKVTYTLMKLDLPFSTDEQAKTMEKVKENGGQDYLEKQSGEEVKSYTFTTEEAHKKILDQAMHPDPELSTTKENFIAFQATPVNYRPVSSPFSERWPFAYEVEPYEIPEGVPLAETDAYRPVKMFGDGSFNDWKRVKIDVKGIFDPAKLNISKDPLTELPMETYFPSKSNLVLDQNGEPVNPPQEMKPLNNPYGFLTKPPMMLTTLDAAAELMGEKPISSIRIKVAGVEAMTDESEKTLQEVAKRIEDETGLITDITLGSSPQPALTHIPGIKGEESIGWVEQPWIKIGSSMTIFKEAKVGLSGVIASVILVAIIYVFSSNLIMMYTRKKEFAVLLSIGWRPVQLSRMLFTEALILGTFVSVVSWIILGYFTVTSTVETSPFRFLLMGLFGILIYLLGTMIPAYLVGKIKPYESMKAGEISHIGRRLIPSAAIWSMSLNSFLSRWKRSCLSVVSIALPTSLFVVFLFITYRLKGVMFATWLGEYVAMEVSSMHYIAMGVALLIAILTTTEIMWQNISERQPEIALLKSIGWKNRSIRSLVLYEGAFSGLFAGIIGIFIAFVFVWKIYGEPPLEHAPFFALAIVIPILTGMAGALFPAHKAVKVQPYQALGGTAEHSGKTEKRVKVTLGVATAILFIGLVTILSQAIPDSKPAVTTADTKDVKGTDGAIQTSTAPSKDETKSDAKPEAKPEGEEVALDREFWKVIEFEKPWNADPLQYTFRLDEPKKAKANTKSIVIKARIQNLTTEDEWDDYKITGQFLKDQDGKEYQPVDTEVISRKNWNGIRMKPGGEAIVSLAFEVPKNKENFNFILSRVSQPGDVVIKHIDKGL